MRRLLFALPLALAAALPGETFAEALDDCTVKFGLRETRLLPQSGTEFNDLENRAELSGVGYLIDEMLGVVSNEAIGDPPRSKIQIFKRQGDDFVHAFDHPVFSAPKGGEQPEEDKDCRADIEGLSVERGSVFVTPSFSTGRKKPGDKILFDGGDVYGKCPAQTSVLHLSTITGDKSIKPAEAVLDIAATVRRFGVLKPFLAVPAKENGFDIEGLAVTEDRIYLGLRGPVLDRNLTPIIVADRAGKARPELRYVDLGGLGIRDMTAAGEGRFLLIAGPMGRINAPFLLYSWNGKDGFPVPASENKPAVPLCTLESGAEGVAVRSLDEGGYEMIVVFDGDVMKARMGRLPASVFE